MKFKQSGRDAPANAYCAHLVFDPGGRHSPVEYVHDSHSRIARFNEEELEDVETGRMSEKTPIATASRTNAPHYGAFTKGGAAKPVVCSYDRAH